MAVRVLGTHDMGRRVAGGLASSRADLISVPTRDYALRDRPLDLTDFAGDAASGRSDVLSEVCDADPAFTGSGDEAGSWH